MKTPNQYTINNTKEILRIIKKNNFTKKITYNKKKIKKIFTVKKEKILLSCLFNNYTTNYSYTILHKKKLIPPKNKIWRELLLNNTEQNTPHNYQSILWLGKTYDINRLYPWTKRQEKLTKQTTIHIRNQLPHKKNIRFTTLYPKFKRQWTMHPQTKQNIHYRLLFKTNTLREKTTPLQYNLKHLSKNKKIKELMNTVYGKHKTTYLHNKNNNTNIKIINNKKAATIIEYRKLKLKQLKQKKNLKEKLDAIISTHIQNKKKMKNKRGYQKNERLPTHISKHDNFKICNLIIKNNTMNRIHIQQHRKLNNLEKTNNNTIKWP